MITKIDATLLTLCFVFVLAVRDEDPIDEYRPISLFR